MRSPSSKQAAWAITNCVLFVAQAMAQNGGPTLLLPDGGLQRTVAAGNSTDGAQVVSELYLGMLASPECAGVRVELSVYQEGNGQAFSGVKPAAYHMRETCVDTTGPLKVVESNGTWIEALNRKKWEAILILQDEHTSEVRRFARVEDNGGTLLLLDSAMQELPQNVPHALGRVTGERQGHMTLLTETDDGRTVEMKPGEVFFLRLSRKTAQKHTNDTYTWTSNRPDAMALLESVGETLGNAAPDPGQLAAALAASQTSAPGGASATSAQRARLNMTLQRRASEIAQEPYQVWQLIAPQQRGQQDLRFELRRSTTNIERPARVFTVSIVVP